MDVIDEEALDAADYGIFMPTKASNFLCDWPKGQHIWVGIHFEDDE